MLVWFDRLLLPGFHRLGYHLWTRHATCPATSRKRQAHAARVYCPPYDGIGTFSLLVHSNQLNARMFHAIAPSKRTVGEDV